MIKKFYNKILVLTLLILFIFSALLPGINGELSKINNTQKKEIVSQETSPLSFYTFDKTGSKQQDVNLSKDISDEIINKLEELKYQILNNPLSEETKVLKQDFVETLAIYGLIPDGMNNEDVLKLLNPSWLNLFSKKTHTNFKEAFIKTIKSSFINPFYRYDITASSSDWNILCNIGSVGSGIPLPLFMLPRPRGAAFWFSSAGTTYASSLLTTKNFIAYGSQQGLAVGFVGVGLTASFYGTTGYIFIGYAIYTMMKAERFEYLTPPNHKPEITDENPADGISDVPLTLSELSFRISDADGDRMKYTVTTSPNIGSGSSSFKKDGIYKIPISGLKNNRGYSWNVEVSDGKDTTVKKFSFYTKISPFNPFDEGWQYRKKIIINHNQVDGVLTDFPVLISCVDSDLKLKAQSDGDDILFMDGPSVANKLYHEIENYDSSIGKLVAWVKLPELSNSIDTVFYMYYGNPTCSSQQYPKNVWNSNYIHIWHLGDILIDSSGLNDGTNHGTNIVSGKIGSARNFERNENDYIDFGDMDQPGNNSLTSGTLEFWINAKNLGQTHFLASKYDTSGEDYQSYSVELDSSGKLSMTLFHQIYDNWFKYQTNNPVITTGSWYYVAFQITIGTTQVIDILVNGEKKSATKLIHGEQPTTFKDIPISDKLGALVTEGGWGYSNALFDEMRWSKVVRPDNWIKTSYNNMYDPSSFFNISPEE